MIAVPRKPVIGPQKPVAPTVTPQPIQSGGYTNPLRESGYEEFARTGGFSPTDLANIRARAVSPVRAVYANAMQNVNRQRALQGGYSPGYNIMQGRLARQQSSGISDAATNAEAGIAEMVQKGRLAGLAGLSQGGGGGGSTADNTPVPEEKHGFWGNLWGGLKKVGKIALPIALGAVTGGAGTLAGAGIGGALKTVGKRAATKIAG